MKRAKRKRMEVHVRRRTRAITIDVTNFHVGTYDIYGCINEVGDEWVKRTCS